MVQFGGIQLNKNCCKVVINKIVNITLLRESICFSISYLWCTLHSWEWMGVSRKILVRIPVELLVSFEVFRELFVLLLQIC